MTPPHQDDDERWMRLALELAAQGQGRVEPNPMVGCVLVKDDTCIGRGYHQSFGGPHAEVNALRSLDGSSDAAGATAYVTLEPCCHHGKTPPCSEALIQSGVARVVVAMRDPFPKVDGGGIRQLRAAGIDVTLDVLKEDAETLLAPYLKRVQTGIPWVIAKWAMTADGRIATVSRQSQWISGPESRRRVHRLRGRVDAIVAGMGTVQADDPMLNARPTADDGTDVTPPRIAKRVVLCRRRLPSRQSKLIQTGTVIPTWLIASPRVDRAELAALRQLGAVVFELDCDESQAMVRQMLALLGDQGMTNVMIEGGAELLGGFWDPPSGDCLVDEFHVYIGAKLFGGVSAPGPIAGEGLGPIELATKLTLHRVDRFANDVRLVYRRVE
ncbi:bifunctional diaminohydroxyphosphoribosylaminopyrimidine deaminase/5-amino-6-(5-phosphoribosylamino)uracil reductase RibD [Stieleria mannarensis]|uniref:bifunctional diaminohydroxyphosphoribosylaminopyrimidine deaminase/5-amino-6-(5-phosphoribosylamino)uracil reductase RibD n=1 Tax=Stieleria mannarensis TaxID=2755585 RepID=UPI00160284AA|nr:bifunctional diaminohydroxyphosphoribosylaminopyrimidine deaminase/5-amino-6-(5-phosphoribosylamino)uracil reductase RibD [Rhodopirellula sp. JC639]